MRGATLALAVLLLAGCTQSDDANDSAAANAVPVLKRFESAQAFDAYVRSVATRSAPKAYEVAEPAADSAAPAGTANPEITNNQTAGVDEGGIVKQIGNFLVVLQDGRLFSVDLGNESGAAMRLTDRANVYRSVDSAAGWYDEMLVQGNRILVTAYSYPQHATEITVMRLSPEGRFTREGRYLLDSEDYYSTENYATRLVGDNLVFYAPHALTMGEQGYAWPRLRRAEGDREPDKGAVMLGPTDIYAPPAELQNPVLHTIAVCPLRSVMDCRTSAFVGPPLREFYVSPTDAFLWIGSSDHLPWAIDYANQRRKSCPGKLEFWHDPIEQSAMLYRLPLDGGAIGAVAVEGTPADQFSFESSGGHFRALLQRAPAGCRVPGGDEPLALLDVPLARFGETLSQVADTAYSPLPAFSGSELENRFIGGWLVYGGRASWSDLSPDVPTPIESTLYAVPLRDPKAVTKIALPHNALRIERAGKDAVVTGYRDMKGLSLSYVRLSPEPALSSTLIAPGRYESEGRSHAFGAWLRSDGSGLIGLPTSHLEWRGVRGWSDSNSSDMSYFAVGADKTLSLAGMLSTTLPSKDSRPPGYRCEVSCIDWYGNSRPIFTGGRIFALMGTELVEGAVEDGKVTEAGRVDLTRPVTSPVS